MSKDNKFDNTVNQLQNKNPNAVMQNIDSLVDDLILSYENKDSDFLNSNDTYGCLNFPLILNSCSKEQIYDLFDAFAMSKDLPVEEHPKTFRLFKFIYHSLKEISIAENRKLDWADLSYYLSLDINSDIYYANNYSPELNKFLNSYLKILDGFNKDTIIQSDACYLNHKNNAIQLKKIFYFSNETELLAHDTIREIILDLTQEDKLETISNVDKYINSIYFNGVSNEENKQTINALLEDFIETDGFSSSGYIVYNIVDSLIRKDKTHFFEAVDEYVRLYWTNEIIDDSGNLNKETYDISKLSLNDKVVLFFTDYFKHIQLHGELISNKFIDLLFTYYDKDIFLEFMDTYAIPYNIAIRSEDLEEDEEDENKVIDNKDSNEFQTYYSLFEYAFTNGLYSVALDIYEHKDSLLPFYAKVIEMKNTAQIVYEYSISHPLSNLDYAEEDILFLISNKIVNKDTLLNTIIKEDFASVDLFFYCLQKGYNQAFIKAYYKSKEDYTDFKLKDYQKTYGMFGLYLNTLLEQGSQFVNPVIIKIFYDEGYSLTTVNNEGFRAVDLLKEFNLSTGVHLITMLEPMFIRDNYDSVINSDTHITISKNNSKNDFVSWFDRDLLEAHLNTLKHDKDNVNLEFIKTMLSNNNHIRKKLHIEDESFFNDLEIKFPNFKEVINYYKGQFRLKDLSGKNYIPPILLLGDPGIGKTLFAKELAQYLKTGYTFIDMASLTAGWILTGNNGSWKSSKQGKIIDAMLKSKTANPIILFDEIEKGRQNSYDPTLVLYQLLEVVNAKEFTDEFIDFSFDASGIIYIACANSSKNMSEPLLSRFKTFNIKKPDEHQIINIIQNIYSEAIRDTKIFNPVLDNKLINFLKDQSLRSIRVLIEEAVSSSLLNLSKKEINELLENKNFITLEEKHFNKSKQQNSLGF